MPDFLFSEGPIRALQQFSSPLVDAMFSLITMAGGGLALFMLAVFVFWFVDRKVGFLITAALLVSSAANELLKNILGMPRPPTGLHKAAAGGNGFPSGHAQQSSAVWLVASLRLRGIWILLGAFAIPLVALSRVYLGVHYVGDVIGGIVIGLGIGAVADIAARRFPFSLLTDLSRVIVAASVPVAVAAGLAAAGQPLSSSLFRLAGAATGFILQERWVRLPRPPNRISLVLRTGLGVPAFVALIAADSRIGDVPLGFAFEFLLGLTIFGALPWLFVRAERFVATRWPGPHSRLPPPSA